MARRADGERREDLTATSESIQDDARRITQIEDEKQDLDIDDPRVDQLSEEAERLAVGLQRKSHVERALAEEGPTEPDEPQARPN